MILSPSVQNHSALAIKTIGKPDFDSSLVRINTSTSAYYFIAPRVKEIALSPTSLGQPIKQIEIINPSDSSWIINLWNRKEFKKLKKSGQIKTRSFVFPIAIFIENK